jgi:hypothetical protein
VTTKELEEMRLDALSPEIREEFRSASRAVRRWEREHPKGLASALSWIDQLRRIFGDPDVHHEPWRGRDFRL